MTVIAPETAVGQRIDLMRQLNDVLHRRPLVEGALALMFTPPGLNIAEDEVLVQVANRGERIVELRPRKLADLVRQDVIHETQVINPCDLMRQLSDVLRRHPLGSALTPMFALSDLGIAEDEVVVQVVNPRERIVELHPRSLADLVPEDVIHETQVINPCDESLLDYAKHPRAGTCAARTNDDGSKSHLYFT